MESLEGLSVSPTNHDRLKKGFEDTCPDSSDGQTSAKKKHTQNLDVPCYTIFCYPKEPASEYDREEVEQMRRVMIARFRFQQSS